MARTRYEIADATFQLEISHVAWMPEELQGKEASDASIDQAELDH